MCWTDGLDIRQLRPIRQWVGDGCTSTYQGSHGSPAWRPALEADRTPRNRTQVKATGKAADSSWHQESPAEGMLPADCGQVDVLRRPWSYPGRCDVRHLLLSELDDWIATNPRGPHHSLLGYSGLLGPFVYSTFQETQLCWLCIGLVLDRSVCTDYPGLRRSSYPRVYIFKFIIIIYCYRLTHPTSLKKAIYNFTQTLVTASGALATPGIDFSFSIRLSCFGFHIVNSVNYKKGLW